MIKPLELHDQRHLETAQGWFQLPVDSTAPIWQDRISMSETRNPSFLTRAASINRRRGKNQVLISKKRLDYENEEEPET